MSACNCGQDSIHEVSHDDPLIAIPNNASISCELKRHSVHAVAQAGRHWPIIEDMTEMSITSRTQNFSPCLTQAVVSSLQNISLVNRSPKAGPPCSGFKLCLWTKKRQVTTDTLKRSALMDVEQRTWIWRLSTSLSSYEVLVRG